MAAGKTRRSKFSEINLGSQCHEKNSFSAFICKSVAYQKAKFPKFPPDLLNKSLDDKLKDLSIYPREPIIAIFLTNLLFPVAIEFL